jgi:hypothetical protein
LIETGVLQAAPIHALLKEHLSGRTDHGNRLWLLVNLEAWHRIHIDRQTVQNFTAELMDAVGSKQPSSPQLAVEAL